jgi:hypothetical protein
MTWLLLFLSDYLFSWIWSFLPQRAQRPQRRRSERLIILIPTDLILPIALFLG